jgi:hypothetical protein
VSPVKYELGFYITEDDILHSHLREILDSYIYVNGCMTDSRVSYGFENPWVFSANAIIATSHSSVALV